MINIVIEDEYTFYRIGMEWLLAGLFGRDKHEGVHCSTLNEDNVADADIIVKKFVTGESVLCQSLLKARKKNSLVIAVHEGDFPIHNTNLPLCLNNTVFIQRSESLSNVQERIFQGWEKCSLTTFYPVITNCFECKHQTLTPQQISVAAHFFLGEGTQHIAKKMNINGKTVSSHKYSIMAKFNLKTDQDLLTLLRLLRERVGATNSFDECLKACF